MADRDKEEHVARQPTGTYMDIVFLSPNSPLPVARQLGVEGNRQARLLLIAEAKNFLETQPRTSR